MIQQRNIAVAIILSIVTCGIYGIYWFIVMTDDVARANDDPQLSGGIAFLLNLVTCGIYGIYWSYKVGKEMYSANQKRGINASDNSVLYLVLAIFGLQIVNYCIIQSELNTIATNSSNPTNTAV